MTPLSDTHARARKLKDVIDKRVRARVSKQIALPVPMSSKVYFPCLFPHFSMLNLLHALGAVLGCFAAPFVPKWSPESSNMYPKSALFFDAVF